MIPYFSDDTSWSKADKVIRSWIGTPCRHLWMAKGRGADCSLFIGAILLELNLIKEVKHDFYPPDWYLHSKIEAVRDGFAKYVKSAMLAGFDLVEVSLPLMRGDMPTFSTVPATGVTNHSGIMLSEEIFIHSARSRGVSEMQWGSYWQKHMTIAYRVVC
jgi:cell wall-associated NlpC family hydrolase